MKRVLLATMTTLAAVVAIDARADTPPSVWDRARSPAAADAYALHRGVQRRIAELDHDGFLPAREAAKGGVRAILERAHAADNPDVRLRFDYGAVLVWMREYKEAAKVLNEALAIAPNHPAADEGWARLSEACGHMGDNVCEVRAYREVLRRNAEEYRRGTPTLNLAEAEMHLGHLREAIEGYREAARLGEQRPADKLRPLAKWGLAVALDRSGDKIGAEREARAAIEAEASLGLLGLPGASVVSGLLRSTEVFFVPAYEVSWYEGLGAAALAREARTPAAIVRLWREAEKSYGNYVRFATEDNGAWLEIAKARLHVAKTERERAERRFGKMRPPASATDDDESERTF